MSNENLIREFKHPMINSINQRDAGVYSMMRTRAQRPTSRKQQQDAMKKDKGRNKNKKKLGAAEETRAKWLRDILVPRCYL